MDTSCIQVLRQVTRKHYECLCTFNTLHISPKCAYKAANKESPPVWWFAFHKVHAAFQRSSLKTNVNKSLVKLWVDWHKAKKHGAKDFTLNAMLPRGQVVLGTINSKGYKATPQMVIVDGQQRLATLKEAEKVVGEPIEVQMPVYLVEKSSPQELAEEFLRWNACNAISKKDYISAAAVEGRMNDFFDKIAQARDAGLMGSFDVGIRPNEERRYKYHEYDIQRFLTWVFYALCGCVDKHFMIDNANKVSIAAIESICRMFNEFEHAIGFKECLKQRRFPYDAYSSDAFMASLARLALVEGVDTGGWLTTQALNFWFSELRNVAIVKNKDGNDVNTLGMNWLNYAKQHNIGGNSTKDGMYASFTRTITDAQREKKFQKFGIPIGRPNQNYTIKFAKAGFGYAPEEGRTGCLEDGTEL